MIDQIIVFSLFVQVILAILLVVLLIKWIRADNFKKTLSEEVSTKKLTIGDHQITVEDGELKISPKK